MTSETSCQCVSRFEPSTQRCRAHALSEVEKWITILSARELEPAISRDDRPSCTNSINHYSSSCFEIGINHSLRPVNYDPMVYCPTRHSDIGWIFVSLEQLEARQYFPSHSFLNLGTCIGKKRSPSSSPPPAAK